MSNKELRPWGFFENLYESETYKVKRISLNPNQSFSLQYHNHRHEDWIVVEGYGVIVQGNDCINCEVGDRFHIESKEVHRASSGPEGLIFIEVQRGVCDEEDIVRIEDNYGRVK